MARKVQLRIALLLTLPAISMFTPSLVRSAIPTDGSVQRLTISAVTELLVLAVIVVVWLEAYRKTYQAAQHRRKWVLLFLLLLPFTLCYPAWFVIAALMSGWKGPPL